MNLNSALNVAQEVIRIKKLVGLNAIYPFKEDQFADAVECLYGHLMATKAEVDALKTKLDNVNKLERKARG